MVVSSENDTTTGAEPKVGPSGSLLSLHDDSVKAAATMTPISAKRRDNANALIKRFLYPLASANQLIDRELRLQAKLMYLKYLTLKD